MIRTGCWVLFERGTYLKKKAQGKKSSPLEVVKMASLVDGETFDSRSSAEYASKSSGNKLFPAYVDYDELRSLRMERI